jgi:hypothetical protein
MNKLLKKVLVPHEGNDFHPHATRHYTLLAYCLAFLLANYLVFPLMGISNRSTLAANIDPDELISLTNKERKGAGLNTLRKNDKLTRAALAKGNDMLKKQYWSHFGPNGETPWQFITSAGYNYVYAGENLAKDFQTSLDTHLAWMNSKTHKENIVKPEFKDIGIAIVSGQFQGYSSTIVVQMFGSEETPVQQPVPTQAQNKPNNAVNPNPQQPLPTVQPLNPPTINKPSEGSIFTDKTVTIEGTSSGGNTLKVFSNNRQIGELPNESAVFTVKVNLEEEKNNIFLRSADTATGRESGDSNHVNVEIDTKAPQLDKIKLQIFRQYKNIYVAAASEEELARVSFELDGTNGDFIKKGNNFEVKLNKDNIKNPQITVKYYDIAGNSSEQKYDLYDSSLDTTTPPVILRTSSGSGGIIASIQNMTITQKINLLFILIIAIIMLFDAIMLLRRGHHRDSGSYHSFNVAVIMITVLGLLTLFR